MGVAPVQLTVCLNGICACGSGKTQDSVVIVTVPHVPSLELRG